MDKGKNMCPIENKTQIPISLVESFFGGISPRIGLPHLQWIHPEFPFFRAVCDQL